MKNRGQILPDSNLGKWITKISSNEDEVQTILEIGTWWGMGSTLCIINGLYKRERPIISGYSFEVDYMRHVFALNKLQPLPENFYLVHGTITESNELDIEIEDEIKQEWLARDKRNIQSARFISPDTLPGKIDLLILDGSVFTGFNEFMKLKDRSKYIILDDTKTQKHSKTREYILLGNDGFEIIQDELCERNGYLICKRKLC